MREFYLLFSYFQAGITHNTVMYLAIFYVFPLQIVGIMEINKKVSIFSGFDLTLQSTSISCAKLLTYNFFVFQVFGNGVTDVVLSQGVIVVSYSNKSVKLYSFEHIVQKVYNMYLFRHVYTALQINLLKCTHLYKASLY